VIAFVHCSTYLPRTRINGPGPFRDGELVASPGPACRARDQCGARYAFPWRHFLDAAGAIPAGIPGAALNLGLFLGAIVAWVTSGRPSINPRTNVAYRRSPKRRRCPGEIVATCEADGSTIVWHCPACGDNG